MRAAGARRHGLVGKVVSLAIIAAAVVFAVHVARVNEEAPSTSDATIDADVVHAAATVGGRVIDIPVRENGHVAAGDLLFQIDPVPYRLALQEAQAGLAAAQASLETDRRALSNQRSAVVAAADQVRTASTSLDLATRTVDRLRPLVADGFVSAQQLDQAQTSQNVQTTALAEARVHASAATQAVDTLAAAEASVQARQAAVALAQRNLDETTVRAPHAGRIVGLKVKTGEIAAPSQSLFTLIDDEEYFAVGNFRETELAAIAVGDCVTAYSMIDRGRPLKGVVDGIGAGVLDTDRVDLPRSVPYVERSLNWVKVAQRFPVRVRLEAPPPELVRVGATAVVEVKHGASCR